MHRHVAPLLASILALGGCAAMADPTATDLPATDTSTASAAPTASVGQSGAAEVPLEAESTVRTELTDGTLLDVSYASRGGGRVSAWMVVPNGEGPFAGIVYVHGSETDRDDLLDEAMATARGGAVALVIDAPFARDGENRTGSLGNYFEAGAEAALTAQAVDDVRRGFDLLVERPDVDPTRLGFVGHSWGASLGAVVAAGDPRPVANVLITPRPSWTEFLRRSDDFAGVRSTVGEDRWQAYLTSMAPYDAIGSVDGIAGERLYLQFGTADDVVVASDVEEWEAAMPSGTRLDRYPAGHALDAQAVADRVGWLVQRLALEPIPAEALADVGLPDEPTRVP